jgi:pyruvate dehydrogenase E1 component alpha subunit
VFENPLLPHKKLTEMYVSMLECRMLERRAASLLRGRARAWRPFAGREATLIGVAHNLLPQDRVSVAGADPVVRFLRGEAPARLLQRLRKSKTKSAQAVGDAGDGVLPHIDDVAKRLAMATGVALVGKAAKEMVVVAYLDAADTREDWTGAIETAGRLELPMVFVCQDDHPAIAEGRAKAAAKKVRDADWRRVGAAAVRLRVPMIPVDGQDLIAMYRAAQEAIGRARMGIGPTVIWCSQWQLGRRLAEAADSLAEFESYLTKRRLLTPQGKRRIAAAFEKKMKTLKG